MVGAVHDLLGRDEREVGVCSDQAAEGAEDEGGVVVENVSVGHVDFSVVGMRGQNSEEGMMVELQVHE